MIEVRNLHKSFRLPPNHPSRWERLKSILSGAGAEKIAVREINFTIEQGEFVGYIGPNGAGKSTTIKMLAGILHPSSGEVRIGGLNPHKDRRRVASRIGVVFGQRSQLWWDLPVRDSFDILAAMYRIDPRRKAETLGELDELLELRDLMDVPVRKLSLGQRMRADLAAALLHEPELLFLDEPTIGLDILAKRNIRKLLSTVNRELGKTVLLTTHDMDDIEQLCSRVMVINHGSLVYDGTIGQLRERIGLPTLLQVTFTSEADVPGPDALPEFSIAKTSGRGLAIHFNRRDIPAMEVLRKLESFGTISDVHMEEPDFEEVIHQIY
ncbi:ABC transporter ATP-binding protein [Paenibacillus naphthalenovorans]|uniref:ABC transporter ATP-binding protein n=1 Tax=Paenibacillus naphthalenovorans TaxID=162209 RepID=UPI0010B3704C|nr:ATP-binding cassette domain-containing protein [Paenibacillus naphthalenovorans]GCL71009.1 ABC transporter ATP-binding protein [Paenibacillus naphthalenovorans]